MAQYDIRPLQLRALNLLHGFHDVCKEHGLRYYITAGTLLGAVRHGGFIPWDDDLDVAMPRSDYELLISNADSWLPKKIELVCAERDFSYPLPFGKLQDASTTLLERPHLPFLGGVYMDVFPLDGVPKFHFSRRWHFIRYEYLKQALYLAGRDPYKHGHGPSSWIPLLARRIHSTSTLKSTMRQLAMTVPFDNASLIVDHDDGLKGVLPRSIVGDPTPITFEGIEVWSYAKPTEYLIRKYGQDYLTPPDNAHRRQHNFFYLDLNTPYRLSAEKVKSLL